MTQYRSFAHFKSTSRFVDFILNQYDTYKNTVSLIILSNIFSYQPPYTFSYDFKIFNKIDNISECDDGYILINKKQKMKLGKFLIKISKCVNNVNIKKENLYIEKIVDNYKSWYKSYNQLKFKLLKGNDILSGYDRYNYIYNNNNLSSSCMNNKFNLLDIYVKNRNKVNLLVLTDNNRKIYGRSLIWKVDNMNNMFMDLVYSSDNYITNLFYNYAKNNKIIRRNKRHIYDLYFPDNKIICSSGYKMKVKLNTKGIKYMPYLDSLFVWNKRNDIFSNKPLMLSKYVELQNTYGGSSRSYLKIF